MNSHEKKIPFCFKRLSLLEAHIFLLVKTLCLISLLCACGQLDEVSKRDQVDLDENISSVDVDSQKSKLDNEAQPSSISKYSYADKDIALASVNPLATEAGLNAIAAGGNAVDAALAMAFTLGVVDSHNSGIGGGCFILFKSPNGDVVAIDGREMAPALAHRDMYIKDGIFDASLSKTGALAVGVPGSVQALYDLQKEFGKINYSDVILPAADIAEKGFAIGDVLAARLDRTQEKIRRFPQTQEIYLPNNRLLKSGEVLVQKDLAATYRKLAKFGPDYFYKGDFAKAVDQWMKENDGIVSYEDFKNYQTKIREPIKTTFNGFDVLGFPTPSSGGIHVGQILNILDQFELKELNEEQRYHLFIEAMKLAFADRAHWLGDADFVPVPKGLVSSSYAENLSKKIDLERATAVESFSYPPNYEEDVFNKHTTHIAAADAEGNWVAITTTLNTSFGSKVVVPGTGVLLNNQMDDFSAQPGKPNAFGLVGAEANSIAPGKRPLSSMSPTIVMKDGEPVMTLGAAGGPTIITQVLQTIVNHLVLDKPLKDAMHSVRVHQQWKPERVFIDDFVSESLKVSLENKGHVLKMRSWFGATQAISRKQIQGQWVFDAQSEPRIQ